jgi:hypothetical protein
MTPSPKDRQNSGISMLEKEQAEALLNKAIRGIQCNFGAPPVLEQIRAAMRLLGMWEQ